MLPSVRAFAIALPQAEYFAYERKRERAKSEGVQAWVNPEEYRQFVAKQKRAFEDQVDLEMGVKR